MDKREKEKKKLNDHGRDRTCNLLISNEIVVKRLAIGPRGQLVLGDGGLLLQLGTENGVTSKTSSRPELFIHGKLWYIYSV
jgi:hypothetical protein